METPGLADGDEIRARFSRRMSDMYRREVPQYGALLDLVADVNAAALRREPALRERLARAGELERLGVERHGAIRLGSARELATMRRVFAVMGMRPVGYYDLSVAGVPVHATAFRPVEDASLARNPFRVFTSLLRLDLIEDAGLRMIATDILERRRIFTPVCWTWSNAPKGREPLPAPRPTSWWPRPCRRFAGTARQPWTRRPTPGCTMPIAWWPMSCVSRGRTSTT